MKLTCPACGCIASVEAFINDKQGRQALRLALSLPETLSGPLIEYLALFRPKERGLTWTRMSKLLGELADSILTARVRHEDTEYVAPLEYWRDALERTIINRDAGTLELPLKGHGYLYSIVVARAKRGAAMAEKERDEQLRTRRRADDDFTPAAREVVNQYLEQMRALVGKSNSTSKEGNIDVNQS